MNLPIFLALLIAAAVSAAPKADPERDLVIFISDDETSDFLAPNELLDDEDEDFGDDDDDQEGDEEVPKYFEEEAQVQFAPTFGAPGLTNFGRVKRSAEPEPIFGILRKIFGGGNRRHRSYRRKSSYGHGHGHSSYGSSYSKPVYKKSYSKPRYSSYSHHH